MLTKVTVFPVPTFLFANVPLADTLRESPATIPAKTAPDVLIDARTVPS